VRYNYQEKNGFFSKNLMNQRENILADQFGGQSNSFKKKMQNFWKDFIDKIKT